jgi:hypothetical protein
MVVVAVGIDVSGTTVGDVVEEAEARVPFFLRSASEFGTKLSSKLNPLSYTIMFSSTIGRKQRRLACMSTWLPYMHAYFEHIMLGFCYHLPSLATVLEMLVGIS